MPAPDTLPKVVHISAPPGDAREAAVTIFQAPSRADVTASIRDGQSLIRLKNVIAFEMVLRAFTEEEIEELPAFPPSIREKARKNGILEEQEVGRSDGVTLLPVDPGARIRFEIEFSSGANQKPDIIRAALMIQGTTWDPVEVPLFFIIADKKTRPTAEPREIRRAAEPGNVFTDKAVLTDISLAAKAAVFVDGGDSIIRLKNWTVSRPVRKQFTEEEIEELPAYPPQTRENARKNGYVEYQETARSDGSVPLDVPARSVVRAYVEFAAPALRAPDEATGSLVFEATTWQTITVPISLIIGKVAVTLSQNSLNLGQGETGFVSVTTTSVAGPGTEVAFELPLDPATWQIIPPSVQVSRAQTVTTGLQIVIAPAAPVGRFQAGMATFAFNRLIQGTVPYDLTIRPGEVFVNLVQSSMSVKQGDRFDLDVAVRAKGGPVRLTFRPGALPAGVTAAETIRDFAPGISAVIGVSFVVDRNAEPVANVVFTIAWSADDGEHKGTLFGRLTVTLIPDSRTFQQIVVTPSGTALGGNVEVVLNNDGSYAFKGHMHDSGFPNYRFRVRSVIRGASGSVAFALEKSGDVEGTEASILPPFDAPRRDFDWSESGYQEYLRKHWADVRAGTMLVNRSFDMAGVLGGLRNLIQDAVDFLVANALLSTTPGGQALAGIIFLGSELGALTNVNFVDPGVIPGLVVSGLTGFLFAPSIVLILVLRNTFIQTRRMNQVEKDLAAEVFGGTLPLDRILLTDMSGQQGQEVTLSTTPIRMSILRADTESRARFSSTN
jgi:hypothetical protein